jgi:hypothetical protein
MSAKILMLQPPRQLETLDDLLAIYRGRPGTDGISRWPENPPQVA